MIKNNADDDKKILNINKYEKETWTMNIKESIKSIDRYQPQKYTNIPNAK